MRRDERQIGKDREAAAAALHEAIRARHLP